MTDDSSRECGGEVNHSSSMSNPDPSRAALADAFRAVDNQDWFHLDLLLGNSAHGQFWRGIFEEVRATLNTHLPPTLNSGAATSPIGQSDVEMLTHLADSMGFGRTHDMLRRVISACPYLALPRAIQGGAVREALQQVYDFMLEDHKSGDSLLWTVAYSEIFDIVDAALSPNTGDGVAALSRSER